MAIFGWLILAGFAVYVTCAGLVMAYVSSGFSGKVGAECWVFMLAGLFLCVVAYHYFPFNVSIK